MQLRRVIIGTAVLFCLSVWSYTRGDGAQAAHADPIRAATAEDREDGTHDAAFHRYQTNQSSHWKQIVVGKR